MKVITTVLYQCEKCLKPHSTEQAAHECEAMPIKHDKGVKVGDEVLITAGDGRGQRAKVTSIRVTQPGWGPRAFDHSIYLNADVIDSWGSRQLSFDSYEVLP